MSEKRPKRSRRCCHLHLGTLLAILVVAASFAYCNAFGFGGLLGGGGTLRRWVRFSYYSYGWPVRYLDRMVTTRSSTTETQWDLRPYGVACDATVGLILLTATALVVESWLRRQKRLQFGLHTMFSFTVVVAAFLATFQIKDALELAIGEPFMNSFFVLPTYAKLPVVFGVGCVFYVLSREGLRLFARWPGTSGRTEEAEDFGSHRDPCHP